MAGQPVQDAAIYARQSHGKERSIEEQLDLGRARCGLEGWHLAGSYVDRVSASRFARAVREDWARLVAGIEAGTLDVLWMYESSRGDRDPETWMGLLRRCRDTRTRIYVETHERLYDITNARDWRTLADEGVDAAYESEKTSLRIRRDLAAAAVAGRPHGLVQYGFARVYDEKTRELVEQKEHPEQGPVVREIIGSIARGVPISKVTAALNERGVPAPRGGTWSRASVRQIAANAAYIGKRRSGVHNPGGPVLYDAMWPAILDGEGEFWAAQRILSDPARKRTRPGSQKHLLSYFAACAVCGAPLFVTGVYYKCLDHGCVYIRVAGMDAWVLGEMTARAQFLVARPEFLAAAYPENAAGAVEARGEAARLQALLDDYTRRAAREEIGPDQLAALTADLRPRIRGAEQRARRASPPPLLAGLLAAREEIGAAIAAGSRQDHRELARDLIASLTVTRAPPGNPREIGGRVVIRWEGEEED